MSATRNVSKKKKKLDEISTAWSNTFSMNLNFEKLHSQPRRSALHGSGTENEIFRILTLHITDIDIIRERCGGRRDFGTFSTP